MEVVYLLVGFAVGIFAKMAFDMFKEGDNADKSTGWSRKSED